MYAIKIRVILHLISQTVNPFLTISSVIVCKNKKSCVALKNRLQSASRVVSIPRIKTVHRLTKNSISPERSECTKFSLQIIKGERFRRNLTLISIIYSVKNAKKIETVYKKLLQNIII